MKPRDRSRTRLHRSLGRQRGFSLLEAVVAFAIAAMALVALYQASGSALSRVGDAEAYSYGFLLAEALMSHHPDVPAAGLSLSGEFDEGFRWEVSTRPLRETGDGMPLPERLHEIRVLVRWGGGSRERTVELLSLRPEAS